MCVCAHTCSHLCQIQMMGLLLKLYLNLWKHLGFSRIEVQQISLLYANSLRSVLRTFTYIFQTLKQKLYNPLQYFSLPPGVQGPHVEDLSKLPYKKQGLNK